MVLGVGVALSMAFLLWVGVKGPEGFVYYVTVTEFLELNETATDGFRINGKVVDGSIERLPSGQDVRFVMSDGVNALPVRYHGVIPDTFVDGADVVVEGHLEDGATLYATTMLAKCPSKYESADEAEPAPAEDLRANSANANKS
jgi:cytochrome c-type biogenesis protein CcmE